MLRRVIIGPLAVAVLATVAGGCAGHTARTAAPLVDLNKVVDLSYTFGPDTIYWPTAESFTMERVSYGMTPGGYWYAANNICMAEHGGTHMDAPIHFAQGARTADAVPLSSCIGPAVVIDVRPHAAADRDYRLTVDDIAEWEKHHGRIPSGAIVIMLSGWGAYWGDKLHYLGTDTHGDVANLHFPGFSKEAAELLVTQRDI